MNQIDERHKRAYSTLGAGAVVLCEEHVVLVQVNYGPAKGHWILPGGMVDPGESPSEAAQRETLEETSLKVNVRGLVAVRHRSFEKGFGHETADVYWVFRAETEETKLTDQPPLKWPQGELLEAKFWPIQEALASETVRPMTQAFIQMAINQSPEADFKEMSKPPSRYKDVVYAPEESS